MICEKCWSDAYWKQLEEPAKSLHECYLELLEERKDPCIVCEWCDTELTKVRGKNKEGQYIGYCKKCGAEMWSKET